MIAIFAVDPGKKTGVAHATFDEGADSIKRAVEGDVTSFTLEGSPQFQGVQICRLWRQFRQDTYGLGIRDAYMIMEDFQVSPATPPGQDIIIPVKIAWFVLGYRLGQQIEWERNFANPSPAISFVWQTPSEAKGYATDARLRGWGHYVRGKDHERDAIRHLFFFINRRLR